MLEVCSLNRSDIKALDYVVDSFLRKVFNTYNKERVSECKEMFNFALVSDITGRLRTYFIIKVHCNKLFEAVESISLLPSALVYCRDEGVIFFLFLSFILLIIVCSPFVADEDEYI